MSVAGDIAGAVSAVGGLGSTYFAWRTVSRARTAASEQAAFTEKMTQIQAEAMRLSSQEATAYDFYSEYLDRAIAHPELYDPSLASNEDNRSPNWRRRYFAFVSALLFSSEEMLRVSGNSSDWQSVVKVQLRNHKKYLEARLTQEHFKELYTPELMNCIEAVCKETAIDSDTPSAGWLADNFVSAPSEGQINA